jgi:deoxyadenosine/deoxycytidine kinase
MSNDTIKITQQPVIVIDGIVGSGKSSLAAKISQKMDIRMFEELNNDDTYILLEKFYKDQQRWSFTLQIHFLNERFKMIKDIHRNGGGILDRSIFGDRIFAEMLNEDGLMSDEEYRTYSTLLDNMLEHTQPPTILVYIDCDVETAIERIKKRNRKMELEVPKRYWERLNHKYQKWYDEYDISPKIKLDGKGYHPNNQEDINNIVNLINQKINRYI